jgi:hypothetical protein
VSTTIANQNLISDFVEFCACRKIDPEMALELLGAQDWEAGKIDSDGGPTEEQWKEFNRALENFAGDPTLKQMEATLTSVMASK